MKKSDDHVIEQMLNETFEDVSYEDVIDESFDLENYFDKKVQNQSLSTNSVDQLAQRLGLADVLCKQANKGFHRVLFGTASLDIPEDFIMPKIGEEIRLLSVECDPDKLISVLNLLDDHVFGILSFQDKGALKIKTLTKEQYYSFVDQPLIHPKRAA